MGKFQEKYKIFSRFSRDFSQCTQGSSIHSQVHGFSNRDCCYYMYNVSALKAPPYCLDITHGLMYELMEMLGLGLRTGLLRGDVEEDNILPSNDIRHSVTVVSHGSEPTTRRDKIIVEFFGLLVRCLAGR